MDQNTFAWLTWISTALAVPNPDARVPVPPWLPHPLRSGFAFEAFAEDHGQVRDFVLALSDGGRVHVHEMPDGALVAHRDRHDPGRGLLEALTHVAQESALGRAAMVGLKFGAFAACALALIRALDSR